ncbi:MAG: hypothetical protein A4E26_00004 [Methanobacterium sp. PtaU1.Bin097]|nr:MAG: hypothetical protein A4E26_00004 [Methanobacterium sp. PtaU1.Bin097]
MLFVAEHTHPASECPMNTPSGKEMIKELFSEEHIKSAGIEMVGAYMSCPADETSHHKGFFIIEAPDEKTVKGFFGPMKVEVREVKPFSEIAKML